MLNRRAGKVAAGDRTTAFCKIRTILPYGRIVGKWPENPTKPHYSAIRLGISDTIFGIILVFAGDAACPAKAAANENVYPIAGLRCQLLACKRVIPLCALVYTVNILLRCKDSSNSVVYRCAYACFYLVTNLVTVNNK